MKKLLAILCFLPLVASAQLNVNNGTATGLTAITGLTEACLNIGTGTVTVATSSSTNVIATWSNSDIAGACSFATNQTVVVTNAGSYLIFFGSFLGGANGQTLKLMVFTNGVHCSIVSLSTSATTQVPSETGMKFFKATLPANCAVDLRVSNDTANSTTIANTCLLVSRR